ncbi:MAG: sialate O-acetylesterase, partial [Verrucomicrobiota bacterium]
ASLESWKEKAASAKKAGKSVPRMPKNPLQEMKGQHRPANLYNGVLLPVIGYTIKGVIWYQGESNSGRAYNYRSLFPLMISQWRKEWGQGAFPFYWVQLADFRDESVSPTDSTWAELREAQTLTLGLPNTGQAVITDRGEAHDIHPKDKQTVAKRLARHALAKDYGFDIVAESPRYSTHQVEGDKIRVHFDHVGSGLDTFDIRTPLGFSVAGKDGVFHWGKAKIISPNQVELTSEPVPNPVAVRYAWSDNPVANVQNKEGLPLTPFRTDNWKTLTKPK